MTVKRVAQRKMLTDKSPTMVKLQTLWQLADKLGIQIYFHNATGVEVVDNDRDHHLPTLWIEDIDDDGASGDFPPATEVKVVFDNPEYLAQQKQEREERNRKAVEAAEQEILRREAAAREEAKQLAKQLEREERAELKRLQRKYGE